MSVEYLTNGALGKDSGRKDGNEPSSLKFGLRRKSPGWSVSFIDPAFYLLKSYVQCDSTHDSDPKTSRTWTRNVKQEKRVSQGCWVWSEWNTVPSPTTFTISQNDTNNVELLFWADSPYEKMQQNRGEEGSKRNWLCIIYGTKPAWIIAIFQFLTMKSSKYPLNWFCKKSEGWWFIWTRTLNEIRSRQKQVKLSFIHWFSIESCRI